MKLADVLRQGSVLPDCDTAWDYIHHRSGDTDIYFLAGSGRAEVAFRVSDKQPELWDPATGRISAAPIYHRTKDGRTVVSLHLPANGSTFVVFRKPGDSRHLTSWSGPESGMAVSTGPASAARIRFWKSGHYKWTTSKDATAHVQDVRVPPALDVVGPWQVSFDPVWGGPASCVFDRLIPWNEHSNPAIKNYSGKATYHATVRVSAAQAASPTRLSLGRVMCIARVRVNGHDRGVVWCDPWTVDITGDLKPDKNELEIDVINTWVNRLIGDAALPPEQRRTKTIVRLEAGKRTLRVFQAFGSTDPLMPSGLIGPVRLQFGTTGLPR